jgi:hypothetical protein
MRRAQKLFGQNATIRDDHRYVSIVGSKELFSFVVLDARGLKHTQPAREGKLFDWRETYLVAAARGSIRLRPHRHHFMAIRYAFSQRRHRSLRCAHEHNSHENLTTDYTDRIRINPDFEIRSIRGYSLRGDLRLQEQQQVIAPACLRVSA